MNINNNDSLGNQSNNSESPQPSSLFHKQIDSAPAVHWGHSLEHLHLVIMAALRGKETQINTAIEAALDKYCTLDNVAQIISNEMHSVIDFALRSEIRRYFTEGEGHGALRLAIHEKLKDYSLFEDENKR
jgi:hypothetical protein